jgi:hypothetical protein
MTLTRQNSRPTSRFIVNQDTVLETMKTLLQQCTLLNNQIVATTALLWQVV